VSRIIKMHSELRLKMAKLSSDCPFKMELRQKWWEDMGWTDLG
jgi:hypothetical protein